MKTLQEIKDEYANEWGRDSWDDYFMYCQLCHMSLDTFQCHMDIINKRFAKEVAKKALINASDHLDPDHFEDVHYYGKTRNKILNESNIPEL